MATPTSVNPSRKEHWLNYRTIWRWHFYAGLFCIPFVLWLATTGSIYLFRPQIEAWLDRPYEHLAATGWRTSGQAQVERALSAVPESNLHYYQLPRGAQSAVQIIVGRNTAEYRVYVNPYNLQVLKVVNEDDRLMKRIFHLHGELLMGDRGSFIVETAASWAIIMLLTGCISGGHAVQRGWAECSIRGCVQATEPSGEIFTPSPECGSRYLHLSFCSAGSHGQKAGEHTSKRRAG
jgi:hypothetical protein